MANSLGTRLDKIETQFVAPKAARRFFRVICNKGDETAALELAKSNGYDPNNEGDFLILRTLVTPAGQTVKPCEPYIEERVRAVH